MARPVWMILLENNLTTTIHRVSKNRNNTKIHSTRKPCSADSCRSASPCDNCIELLLHPLPAEARAAIMATSSNCCRIFVLSKEVKQMTFSTVEARRAWSSRIRHYNNYRGLTTARRYV